MSCMMGIDLGTSSLKVVVVDDCGKIRSSSSRDYQFDSPHNGYAEQRAEVWWSACKACVRESLSNLGLPAADVRGVSFSGQMHGAVLLDLDMKEVRPAILHCDARSGDQVREMEKVIEERSLRDILFNPVYTGFLLPSLIWVRENEPENYARVRHVVLPKDFLKMKLCGAVTSDFSDASATLAFDIENVRWSAEVLEAMGVSPDIFPQCLSTVSPVGRVTRDASEETGLVEGTVVVNGGGDQIMQAIGNGAIRAGHATVNIGTSGQVCFQSDRPIRNPCLSTNTFCGYESARWITMGATMSAGLSLKWFNNLFDGGDYRKIDAEIERLSPGSGGLIFLPYLNGERTPHVNPDLSGMFMGLNLNTRRAHMARAVMEGVAFSLMQCIEVCDELGLHASSLIASGGGARSPQWLQIQADVYGVPLRTAATEEQAGVGAAIVAGVGSGVFSSVEEGCARVVRYKDTVYVPNAANHAIYAEYYRIYKDTYRASRDVLQRVTCAGRKQASLG